MDSIWFYIIWLLGSYILGSVLIGELICRAKGIDIRKLGTGNPGTANIWREVGYKYGIAVFALDVLKGVSLTLPLALMNVELIWIAATMICTLMGQFLPVFFKFRGNTGMAVLFGTSAGLVPFGALIGAPILILMFIISRNSGWSGAAFFLVCGISGVVIYVDDWEWLGVIYLMLGSILVVLKQHLQYSGGSSRE